MINTSSGGDFLEVLTFLCEIHFSAFPLLIMTSSVCFWIDFRPIKALRKQTQQWQFGKQAIAFSTPTFIKQLEPTDRHEDPSVNVVKREFQNIKDYDLNYFRFEFIVLLCTTICSQPIQQHVL